MGHGVDICPNTAHSKKKKIQGNKEEEPRNKRSQYINHSENKLTIHLLDFYRNLPLNHEVHA